jgi:ADP-ribose pyrophosphatase
MYEKTIKTRRIYKGRIISLREDIVKLSNGVISKREIVEHPGAVAVIALTKDKKIVMIRQFRKTADKVLYEIPAGLAHKKENLTVAARRELLEESGYKAKSVKKVFSGYSTPGYSTEVLHYFLATGLTKASQNCDFDEMIDVELIGISKALQMVKKGKVRDSKTIVGILYAAQCKNL